MTDKTYRLHTVVARCSSFLYISKGTVRHDCPYNINSINGTRLNENDRSTVTALCSVALPIRSIGVYDLCISLRSKHYPKVISSPSIVRVRMLLVPEKA